MDHHQLRNKQPFCYGNFRRGPAWLYVSAPKAPIGSAWTNGARHCVRGAGPGNYKAFSVVSEAHPLAWRWATYPHLPAFPRSPKTHTDTLQNWPQNTVRNGPDVLAGEPAWLVKHGWADTPSQPACGKQSLGPDCREANWNRDGLGKEGF